MKEPEKIRAEVACTYAKALRGEGGCCAPLAALCGAADRHAPPSSAREAGGRVPKGVAAGLALYRSEDLAALPSEAVRGSFGCGNPVAFGEIREGDVVLDLGSGAGIDLLLAARKVGPGGRVIGVDMTAEMIARARENAAAAGLANIEVREGLIEDLPVESASVDWVISNCVINLSPEKPRVFAEIARVLKPGGRMVVSDLVARDLPAWVRESASLYACCIAGAISEEEYVAGLRMAGLADIEVRERIVYEPSQVAELLRSYLRDGAGLSSCCGGATALIQRAAEAVAGEVWSARFHARKPAA